MPRLRERFQRGGFRVDRVVGLSPRRSTGRVVNLTWSPSAVLFPAPPVRGNM
jgi:hypothetical protein